MYKKKVKLCILLLSGLGLAGLQAQEAVPATGGNASGSGGTVSYSVGQIVYGKFKGISRTGSTVLSGDAASDKVFYVRRLGTFPGFVLMYGA